MRANAMLRPSGDQAGLIHSAGCVVRRSGFSLPSTFTYRSNRSSGPSGDQANATWLPSGENVGDTSWPGYAVSGTTVIGGRDRFAADRGRR